MPNLLRTESNERLDLSDFQFVSESIREHGRHLGDQFMANPTGNRAWVLSGFGITNPSGKQLQVTRGRALLALRDGANVLYGFVTTEGDATKIVDLTGQSPGTYNIYIRFEFVDGASGSRIFWNAAGNGNEFAQTINTRQTANWGLRVETGSPGSEWLKIGEVDQASMAITDQRPLYFEGVPSASYATTWGAGNDRNADRQQYGVTDLQTFTEAMRTCIEDIKGAGIRNWWDDSIGGLTVGFAGTAVEDRVQVGDDEFYLDGSNSAAPKIVSNTTGGTSEIEYSRVSDNWRFRVLGNSALFLADTYASFAGAGIVANRLNFLDGDFGFDFATANNPRVVFDSDAWLNFNRSANEFDFEIAGGVRAQVGFSASDAFVTVQETSGNEGGRFSNNAGTNINSLEGIAGGSIVAVARWANAAGAFLPGVANTTTIGDASDAWRSLYLQSAASDPSGFTAGRFHAVSGRPRSSDGTGILRIVTQPYALTTSQTFSTISALQSFLAYSIPANTLTVGSVIRIRFFGEVTALGTATQVRAGLKIGNTTASPFTMRIVDTTPVAVDGVQGVVDITVQAIGATGTMNGSGQLVWADAVGNVTNHEVPNAVGTAIAELRTDQALNIWFEIEETAANTLDGFALRTMSVDIT